MLGNTGGAGQFGRCARCDWIAVLVAVFFPRVCIGTIGVAIAEIAFSA
jgi:hypothetical protein